MAVKEPLENVTAIIKTFERPESLDNLIRSIRRFYPDLQIIVADDSLNPQPRSDVRYLALDHDVGLSAGRNALLASVETPYFLLLDDDLEFTKDTRIERLAAIVASRNISIAGGEYIFCRSERRLFRRTIKSNVQPYNGMIYREGQNLTVTPGYYRQVHDYFVCDIVHNFFVAKTHDVRAVGGWDEDLKLNEHEEFFLRVMQQGFGVAYFPNVTVRHWCARSEYYSKYRYRDYVGLAMSKHGISVYTDMFGVVRVFDPPRAA